MEKNENEYPYIRIGTKYYKISEIPDIYGNKTEALIPWSKDNINTDHGKKVTANIEKLDGFVIIPDHLNYQKRIDNFYNRYQPLPIEIYPGAVQDVLLLKEKIKHTLGFLAHIFGNQIELAVDYLKILLLRPEQKLPILCLVSTERATGKSTFIKWLQILFGMNATYVKGDAFASQFNSDWSGKLLVLIDEAFLDNKQLAERLKFLSTTNRDKLEKKGIDRVEVDFFAKFILCSNNETSFVQIDPEEIRFWVRKIKSIEIEDINILDKLKAEASYFLRNLKDRPYCTEPKTRMWFTPEQIRTKALERLIFKNNNPIENKMAELFFEYFQSTDDDKIEVVPKDVVQMLKQMFNWRNVTRNQVRKILKERWKLEPQSNGLTYSQVMLTYDGDFYSNSSVGRFYTIEKKFIQKFVELLN